MLRPDSSILKFNGHHMVFLFKKLKKLVTKKANNIVQSLQKVTRMQFTHVKLKVMTKKYVISVMIKSTFLVPHSQKPRR